MGRATHAQVAEEYARKLRRTDQGRSLIASYREMVEDRTGIAYTNAIGQPFRGWTDGQIAVYARVHHLIASGRVAKLTVPVDAVPSRDAARTENEAKLTAGLPDEFTAEIYEGTSHDGDGLLSWPQGTAMPWIDGYGNQSTAKICDWADSAPLEIGHTDASRTWLHLMDYGMVARWPYGSQDIWFFYFPTAAAWDETRFRGMPQFSKAS